MEKPENHHKYKQRSPAYLRRLKRRSLQRQQTLFDAREASTEEVKSATAIAPAEKVDVAEEATQTEKVCNIAKASEAEEFAEKAFFLEVKYTTNKRTPVHYFEHKILHKIENIIIEELPLISTCGVKLLGMINEKHGSHHLNYFYNIIIELDNMELDFEVAKRFSSEIAEREFPIDDNEFVKFYKSSLGCIASIK